MTSAPLLCLIGPSTFVLTGLTSHLDTLTVIHLLRILSVFLPLAVIATMRDLKRKDKLLEAAGDTYGKTLSLAVLDVCSDESVKQCINGIKDRHVDVLSG